MYFSQKDLTNFAIFWAGFEILAFPCNQFAGQEPGSNEEIQEVVCTMFKAEFPVFDKVIPYEQKRLKLTIFCQQSIYAIPVQNDYPCVATALTL